MAGISKRDEAPASWKKLGTPFEKVMLSQREKLTEALAALDFSLCHDIINEMAESYEENGGVDDRVSSVLSDAPDLVASLAAAVSTPRASERSPRVSERAAPEPIARCRARSRYHRRRRRSPSPICRRSARWWRRRNRQTAATQRSVAEIERDIAFAVGASDFQRAIELREELKRAGGSVPGDDSSADPFADGPPSKSAPPRPAKLGSTRMSERSGSGVSQLTGGSAEEIDAEITKLTNAMNATKALADKWAAIGNNGARQAAEEQVAQMQREIAELQQKRDGGAGGDHYQALPAPAILPSTAPIPAVDAAAARRNAASAAAAAAAGPPPRPAMRPPPRPALAVADWHRRACRRDRWRPLCRSAPRRSDRRRARRPPPWRRCRRRPNR
jgi:hypothetical protein